METSKQRARRRFAFGALEQLATIFGAITASVLTVGLFLPAINIVSGHEMLARADLIALALLVLGFSAATTLAAMFLRGMARRLEDGHHHHDGAE